MGLKREIKCVLCTERMQFQYLCTKRWFEKFWSGILSVKRLTVRVNGHAPSGQPRLIRIKLRFKWTIIFLLMLETLLVISRYHIKVFWTIITKLIKSIDSTLGCRTRRGHLTEAQLVRRTGICNLLIGRKKNHHFLNSFVIWNDKLIVYNNLK